MNRLYDRKGPFGFANIAKDTVLSANSGDRPDRLVIGTIEVGNSSNANAECGWGYKVPDAMWVAGLWDASETGEEFVDDTTDAQDAGLADFALGSTTNNDGFVVAADEMFNIVGLTINTAAGSTPTLDYAYWNGSAWANLEPYLILAAPNLEATGDVYLGFLQPVDWAAVDDSANTSTIPDGKFAIRVRCTEAATSAALANIAWVVNLLDYVENVSDGKSIKFNAQGELRIPHRASIVPFCGTANSLNWCTIEYRQGG